MADFKWDPDFELKIKAQTEIGMQKMCSYLVGDIKRDMKPGFWREWPSKTGDGSIHWSSQPGDAPSPDTHALQDSISYSTSGGAQSGVGANSEVPNVGTPPASPVEIQGIVGTQDWKGARLEMGVTSGAIPFAPRPFMRTAIPRNKETLRRIFINSMRRAK